MKDDSKPEAIKTPWPTKEAMQQVYEMNLWGGDKPGFYSGVGSHDPEIVLPYLKTVISFLKSFEDPITVCDLGCGDFNVGFKLVKYTKKYIAVDIVPELIDRNRNRFTSDNLEFRCVDIAKDELPYGDCAILRQVLQHLSNYEVEKIVSKLSSFKYVILTEHLPEGDFIPNKDIISGQGTRLKKQSGIDIRKSPFNLKVKEEKQLLSVVLKKSKGVITTTLYQI